MFANVVKLKVVSQVVLKKTVTVHQALDLLCTLCTMHDTLDATPPYDG